MKVFGSISRLVSILFRKDSNDITVRPNQGTTYSASRDVQLPPGDADHVLVSATSTQTLTNKTLTSPVINSPTGITKGDVGLGNVDNTSDATKNSATATLTNKTIDATSNTISNIANANIASGAAIAVNKLAALTASRAVATDGSGFLSASSVTSTELGYVSGVTSSIQSQFTGKQSTSEKGAANGYASLDSGGKVPVSQLPNSIMEYLGTWSAATNTPTLADGTGNTGDVYVVSASGTVNFGSGNITFLAGDWVVYNGSVWEKSINSNSVASVFGRTGAVTAQSGDYTAAQVTNTPAGNIAATTVQAALNELDSEKLATADFSSTFATTIAGYSFSTNWTSGTTKTVTHNLGTRLVNVTIYDNTTFETLYVDSEVRTDANTLDLTSSEAPSGSGWKVLVSKA